MCTPNVGQQPGNGRPYNEEKPDAPMQELVFGPNGEGTVTPRHSVSVAGIVVNNADQVLVVQRRDNGHWEPPGGVLELNEQFEEGVRREVREETGMDIRVDRLTGVYKNLTRGIVALVFRCAPLGDPGPASAEAVKVRWVDLAEIPDLMDPAYAIRVTDAFGDTIATRAHDGVQLIAGY